MTPRYPAPKPTADVTGEMWQKMLDATVIAPLAKMLGEFFHVDPADFDTIEEIETKLQEFFGKIPILGDLIEIITGVEDGDLDDLGTWVSNVLRPGLTGIIDWSRIPQIALSQLTNQPSPNLLTGFGDFADQDTMDGGGDWTWDGTVGDGSAKAVASGARKVLTSELVAVSEGQEMTIAGKVRKQAAVGSGTVAQLVVMPFIGDAAQSEVVIGGVGSGTDMAGTVVTSDYTPGAGITGVRVRITVEAAFTSGSVWWDDVTLRKVATSLPQQFISGLTDALSNLGDWIESLVNQLLGALGVPALGTLFDKISDLSDEVEGWLGDTQDRAAELANLISGLLSAPGDWLGSLSMGKITGLAGELADKASTTVVASVQNFILDLANAILSAIRKVPVVGGTIADRIEDVIDDLGGLKDQADGTKAGIVAGWTGGSSSGADTDVYDTMATIKSLVQGEGYTRVLITSSQSWTPPAGIKQCVVVGISSGQNGGAGTKSDAYHAGGAGGLGGGHKVQALDVASFTSLYFELGVSGAALNVRQNGSSGTILMSAVAGGGGALADIFGYAQTGSSAGNGGAGGYGGTTDAGWTAGGVGGSTPAATGGAGGTSQGASGTAGTSLSTSMLTPCGGSGGGGGAGRASTAYSGGDGAAGGFPGGGGGGGGSNSGSVLASAGSGGAGAAPLAYIYYQ